MSETQRPGLLGPAIAVALAVLMAGASLDRFRAHVRDNTATRHAQEGARAIAADPSDRPPLAGAHVRAWLVANDHADGKYAFLRRLRLERGDPTLSRSLAADNPHDKALADLYALGMARGEYVSGPRAAVRVPGADAVAIVDASHALHTRFDASGFWTYLLMALPGALGLLCWIGLTRWRRTSRWLAPAGAAITGAGLTWMAWSQIAGWQRHAASAAAETAERFGVSADALVYAGDASVAVAAPLTPLVIAGVVGWFTHSRRSPHRAAYAYVAPALIGLGVLVLAPFLFGMGLAFMRHTQGQFEWVGLDNFARILTAEGRDIWRPLSFYFTLAVTIAWTAINVVLHAGIGLGLALLLNRPDLPFKGVYRMLLIVPWAVPNYITALIWKGMFNKQYGLINNLLAVAHIEPIGWFSEFWTAFTANVITNTWLGFPFMMVVCLGALQSIPGELYEAADIDGASRWARFRHITLPLLKPALLPAVILGSIWTFNMFNIVYLVSGGQPNNSTDILITEAYRRAFEQGDYGYAAAYSVLIFVILLSYTMLTQRVARSAEGAHA